MTDPAGNLWLVLQLARESLRSGTLRGYWPALDRHAAGAGAPLRAVAALVWAGLLPVVPVMAARRRRLTARALEGVVRAVVAGVDARVAVRRAAALLERRGLDPEQARADLERLVAGFLASPSRAGDVGARVTRVG